MIRMIGFKFYVFIVLGCALSHSGVTTTQISEHFHLKHDDDVLFQRFVQFFNRTYHSDLEQKLRFKIFSQNLKAYRQKTYGPRMIGDTANYGITKHADMNATEFQSQLLGVLQSSPPSQDELKIADAACDSSPIDCNLDITGVPSSFDWRKDSRNVISPIKNQARCGGCWAFSTVETVESMWRIANNSPIGNGKLSVQQVISCTKQGNGCLGGYIDKAFQYVLSQAQTNGGIEQDNKFPFQCSDGCPNGTPGCEPVSSPFASINSTCRCQQWSEDKMKAFVGKYGPLSIKVDADPWNGYTGGIIRYHCSSSDASGDHAVQIIGYGTENVQGVNIDYWIVRNSWGSDWGENGYLRIARGSNVCGVANDVNFAFAHPA